MAFGQRQIFSTDFQPNVAIGLDLPFNGPAVFRSTYQSKDAVKVNLVNYLLTNPGERIANPSFGAGLRQFIFEQITDGNLEFLEDKLQEDITNNIPNVNLQNLTVTGTPDLNTVNIIIDYSIADTGITDNVELTFS